MNATKYTETTAGSNLGKSKRFNTKCHLQSSKNIQLKYSKTVASKFSYKYTSKNFKNFKKESLTESSFSEAVSLKKDFPGNVFCEIF